MFARVRGLLRRPAVRQRVLAPVGFDAAILTMNLITGVAVARALGPTGRGELAAILLLAQTAAWIFAMGGAEAVSYRLAREPKVGNQLLGGWIALCIPLSLLAIAISELALPVLFSAQTPEAIDLARLFLAYVFLVMANSVFSGMLLGDENFLNYNIARLIPPVLIAVGYIGTWISGHFEVELALIINAIAATLGLSFAAWKTLQRHGLARPKRKLMRETLWYGVRAHAGSLAGVVNARLDLLIIPAFLGAASIGLYSVATNTTSVIATLTGTVAIFALPVAVRQRKQSTRTVIRTFHAVLLIGLAIAIPLEIFAHPILALIYGSEFYDAGTSMRILLPGAVLDACAIVLWSGLLAANRPFLSSIATLPAALLTVVGLLIFLQEGGIEVAAAVTSTAYTTTFLISLFLYRRVMKIRWRDFVFAPPADPAPSE